MELTSSPPLGAATSSARPPSEIALPSPRLTGKKRARCPLSDTSYTNSSDLPLFSSDEPDTGAENYTTAAKRRKRTFQGPWWTTTTPKSPTAHAPRSQPIKRTFQRNFDSGVFMGSDITVAESDIAEEDPDMHVNAAGITTAPAVTSSGVLMYEAVWSALAGLHDDPEQSVVEMFMERQQHAANIIAECVDDGKMVVDVSDLSLRVVLDSTLRPLHCLIRQEQNQSLEPSLRLYMTNNELRTLPSGLYQLQHLTTLSVRGNSLGELGSQIGQLKLTELNVSANQLRYLPFSVISLFRMALQRSETFTEFLTPHLRLRPNPFVVPVSRSEDSTKQPQLESDRLTLTARSVPCYLTIIGTPLRGPCPSRPGSLLRPANMQFYKPVDRTHVPSLFELSLRSIQQHRRTASFIGLPNLPSAVIVGLTRVEQTSIAGPVLCDVCAATYIVPRGEWLEWYAGVRDNEDELVPLLRRACSWACVDEVFFNRAVEAETHRKSEDVKESEATLPEEWLLCGWREV